jgi:uncharacterized protein YndB with AHSA1/START domain
MPMNSDQTTGTTQREMVLTRVFDAPRGLVFQAWTDSKHVQQWWCPEHFTNTHVEMDVQPGGAFTIHMQAPDGAIYPATGVFHEVTPPERLVFTSKAFEDEEGNAPLEVLNTVTFEEHDGRTTLTLQAVVIKATPEMEGALAGMEEGWNQSLDKLENLLTNR